MVDGYLLGRAAVKQVEQLFREWQARYANPMGHRGRWQDHTPPRPGSTSSSSDSSSGSDSESGSSSGSDTGTGSDTGSGTGTGSDTGTGSTGTGGTGSSGTGSDSSGSTSSSGSSSGTGSSGTGDTGSDKSTAIVPASWSPKGFTALFVSESPEVRFDDVLVIEMPQRNAVVSIDPKFVEVCEPGSIEVCGWSVNRPVLLGAAVDGGLVDVEFAERHPDRLLRVVLRLTGIRKGFAGHRFPERSRAQYDANERFIRSAYNSEE